MLHNGQFTQGDSFGQKTPNINNFESQLDAYILVNGLNPEIFVEWTYYVQIVANARRHKELLLCKFVSIDGKYDGYYAYNLSNNNGKHVFERVYKHFIPLLLFI